MPTPVQTQIGDAILTRLRQLTVENEYIRSVRTVDRRHAEDAFAEDELPAASLTLGNDTLIDLRAGTERREIAFTVQYRALRSEAAHDLVVAELAADLRVVLNRATGAAKVSDTPSPDLGGIVTSLRIESIEPLVDTPDSAYAGVSLAVVTRYQIAHDDPFTLVP